MKKLIAGLALMLITSTSYAAEFVCTGYIGSKQAGEPIKVVASKVMVAETKAYNRFKKAGIKVDVVRCK